MGGALLILAAAVPLFLALIKCRADAARYDAAAEALWRHACEHDTPDHTAAKLARIRLRCDLSQPDRRPFMWVKDIDTGERIRVEI